LVVEPVTFLIGDFAAALIDFLTPSVTLEPRILRWGAFAPADESAV